MPKGVYVRTKPVWNRGLDMNDPRVKKNVESRNATMLDRYGSTTYNNPEKRKQTNMNKYGVDNVFQILEFINVEKRKKTNLDKYGFESPSQNDKVKEKNRETFLNNHPGYSSVSQLPGVGEKISNSASSSDVKEKKKETFLKRYDVEYGLQNDSIMKKKLSTTLQRYGTIYYPNKEKEYETKRKNNSFNTSNPENEMYKDLCNQYGEEDVIHQYRDERYPYVCDFYIKSLDLFIELNKNWTHGNHPYDLLNPEDKLKLEQWQDKSKTSDYYKNAIYTWTDLDVRKQQIAKENNLNYITIY